MTNNGNIPWSRILTEGGAIVISILLAFWIDAWWSERQERQAELDYLIALQKDFGETRDNLQSHIDRVAALFDQVNQVLNVIADTNAAELPDAFSKMVGDAYVIPHPVAVTGTYEDMVNSGNLRLLRDEELRVTMAEFMNILENLEFHSNLTVQTFWALHAPFINERLLMNEFGWSVEDNNSTDLSVTYLVDPAIDHPFRLNADAVRTREFWNLMIGWKVLYSDQLERAVRARNLSFEVTDMISADIEYYSR